MNIQNIYSKVKHYISLIWEGDRNNTKVMAQDLFYAEGVILDGNRAAEDSNEYGIFENTGLDVFSDEEILGIIKRVKQELLINHLFLQISCLPKATVLDIMRFEEKLLKMRGIPYRFSVQELSKVIHRHRSEEDWWIISESLEEWMHKEIRQKIHENVRVYKSSE